MPANVEVPLYFTIQPGGVYVANPSGACARLNYPNYTQKLLGTQFNF